MVDQKTIGLRQVNLNFLSISMQIIPPLTNPFLFSIIVANVDVRSVILVPRTEAPYQQWDLNFESEFAMNVIAC